VKFVRIGEIRVIIKMTLFHSKESPTEIDQQTHAESGRGEVIHLISWLFSRENGILARLSSTTKASLEITSSWPLSQLAMNLHAKTDQLKDFCL
jgi:hypothetical protein